LLLDWLKSQKLVFDSMTSSTGSSQSRAAFAVGNRMRLQGLIGRTDLNGTVVCILEASSPAEREKMEKDGRVKVTGICAGVPKSLSVKREHVVALGECPVDWTFCDSPPLSLLELVRAQGM
jgi:hypothetical protein